MSKYNWTKPDDVDCNSIEELIVEKLDRLFGGSGGAFRGAKLVFWIDSNSGFNFDVFMENLEGEMTRISDQHEWWHQGFGAFDEAFEALTDDLADRNDFVKIEAIDDQLRKLVRKKCENLEQSNFGYAPDPAVAWKIQDEE